MARQYTKAQIEAMIEKAAESMATFYQQDFIKFRGRTCDSDELYSEITARWCCDNISRFEDIPMITRETSYMTASHDGIPPNSKSNRNEELIAMAIFRQGDLPPVGKILDYQTPLKNKRSDKAGKIDLLSFDGKQLRILELKDPDNEETMLRCVLEGFTYLKTVNYEKLLCDFSLPEETMIQTCPLVFHGGVQWQEMQQERPELFKLMKLWGCRPYYLRFYLNRYVVEV